MKKMGAEEPSGAERTVRNAITSPKPHPRSHTERKVRRKTFFRDGMETWRPSLVSVTVERASIGLT
jgi:hypothetical protein